MTQISAELLGRSRIEILSVELKNNSVYIEVATDHDEIECQKCGKPIPLHWLFRASYHSPPAHLGQALLPDHPTQEGRVQGL